ncbi:hypothetical protein [Mycolicibacter longobardus]|uniref:PE-PGRS family protein n=1 Tax=Mycolicibacter longobardus TaxID=1108812 RepID=A0A1X1YAW7_9MYCO|nr:hypothetical protein [Mycolicibacter longobardus]ORW08209.1 hypothetical protein AWC16_19875 [Mycolicibacter longobardus]
MQQTLRPYVTTGLAIVGVGLVAAPPVASHLPQLQHELAVVQQRDVVLTDFFSPWTDLFANTTANLQALNQNSVDMWGLMVHIFTNPQQALAGIPDVINIFTNPLPGLDVQALPFPVDVDLQLPLWATSLLTSMGPMINVFNAMQQLIQQIFDFSDPMGALSALMGAPATLLDAFLNGSSSFDFLGFSIPLFNGILTPAQPGISIDIGTIVDASGLGNSTITDLLTQAGIGDTPLDTLIIDLLDQVGYGHMTPVDLLEEFGIGTESLSNLLIGLFNEAGIGNPTIADLLTDLGGISPDDSIASLLIALLNSPEVGIGNPTLSELILGLVGGDDQTVGGLIKDLLGAQGSESLSSLVDPTWTVGGLLRDSMGNPPLTEFFEQIGLGGITVGSLTGILGEYGDQTLIELMNEGFLGPDITGGTGLLELLSSFFPPGSTLGDLLGPMATQTVGELLESMPVGENELGIDPLTPLTDIRFTQLMTIAGMGDTPLAELSPENASLINKIGNPTLNALLGPNTVGQTVQNLGFYNITMAQMLQAMGIINFDMQALFDGLGNLSGNVTLEEFFTDLGFNPTLAELMTSIFDGLGLTDTTLNSLFEDWGMGSIPLGNLIDALGLDDLNIRAMLDNLGLNNIDLDMVIDRFGLSGISIAGLLSDLGFDTRHLDQVIEELLGGVSIGSMLGGLGLDEVYLDSFITDVMTSVLGDPSLGTFLGWLGLDNYDLNTIIGNLGLDGVTINSLLTDLGFGSVDISTLFEAMGLSDLGLLDFTSDFYGLLPQWLNEIPQQIAEALGYFG